MTLDFTAKMKYNISSTLFRDRRDTMQKTSIRFFEDIPVRAVWDDESSKWWFCAMDIAEAITKTTNPRVYWATVKRRNPELIAICKQLKLKARDGKFYNTDVIANAIADNPPIIRWNNPLPLFLFIKHSPF